MKSIANSTMTSQTIHSKLNKTEMNNSIESKINHIPRNSNRISSDQMQKQRFSINNNNEERPKSEQDIDLNRNKESYTNNSDSIDHNSALNNNYNHPNARNNPEIDEKKSIKLDRIESHINDIRLNSKENFSSKEVHVSPDLGSQFIETPKFNPLTSLSAILQKATEEVKNNYSLINENKTITPTTSTDNLVCKNPSIIKCDDIDNTESITKRVLTHRSCNTPETNDQDLYSTNQSIVSSNRLKQSRSIQNLKRKKNSSESYDIISSMIGNDNNDQVSSNAKYYANERLGNPSSSKTKQTTKNPNETHDQKPTFPKIGTIAKSQLNPDSARDHYNNNNNNNDDILSINIIHPIMNKNNSSRENPIHYANESWNIDEKITHKFDDLSTTQGKIPLVKHTRFLPAIITRKNDNEIPYKKKFEINTNILLENAAKSLTSARKILEGVNNTAKTIENNINTHQVDRFNQCFSSSSLKNPQNHHSNHYLENKTNRHGKYHIKTSSWGIPSRFDSTIMNDNHYNNQNMNNERRFSRSIIMEGGSGEEGYRNLNILSHRQSFSKIRNRENNYDSDESSLPNDNHNPICDLIKSMNNNNKEYCNNDPINNILKNIENIENTDNVQLAATTVFKNANYPHNKGTQQQQQYKRERMNKPLCKFFPIPISKLTPNDQLSLIQPKINPGKLIKYNDMEISIDKENNSTNDNVTHLVDMNNNHEFNSKINNGYLTKKPNQKSWNKADFSFNNDFQAANSPLRSNNNSLKKK